MDFSWLGREWEDECEIKKKFNFFDNNPQNGQLSYRELQSAMYGIGYNHSDEEIRKMIEDFDLNKNNEIDFKEFLLLLANNHDDIKLRLAFAEIDNACTKTTTVEEIRTWMRNQHLSRDDLAEPVEFIDDWWVANGGIFSINSIDFDKFKDCVNYCEHASKNSLSTSFREVKSNWK